MANYQVAQLNEIPALTCPCGFTHRAFGQLQGAIASVHWVEIQADARTHYHKKLTEIYLVLEGEGQLELDGQLIPAKPLTAALIQPGCRHRALGRMNIANIVIPAFDPADEWFD